MCNEREHANIHTSGIEVDNPNPNREASEGNFSTRVYFNHVTLGYDPVTQCTISLCDKCMLYR